MRNWVRIRVPPSINSVRIPSCERSCRIVSGVIGSVLATITVATRRNAAKCSGDAPVPAITIFRPVPSVKNRACGSSRPLALTVTLTGSAGLPCAVLFSRSFSLRVTNAGLSLRMASRTHQHRVSHSARKRGPIPNLLCQKAQDAGSGVVYISVERDGCRGPYDHSRKSRSVIQNKDHLNFLNHKFVYLCIRESVHEDEW